MTKKPRAASAEKRIQKGTYHDKHTKTDNGGMRLIEKAMQHAIKTPCAECPLRRDSASGFLGGYSPEMYLDIMASAASIACHSSPGFHEGIIETQRHCTGVSAFRANAGWITGGFIKKANGQPYFVTSHAHESTQIIGHDEETYFSTPQEFVDHHRPGQEAAHAREREKRRSAGPMVGQGEGTDDAVSNPAILLLRAFDQRDDADDE